MLIFYMQSVLKKLMNEIKFILNPCSDFSLSCNVVFCAVFVSSSPVNCGGRVVADVIDESDVPLVQLQRQWVVVLLIEQKAVVLVCGHLETNMMEQLTGLAGAKHRYRLDTVSKKSSYKHQPLSQTIQLFWKGG